MKRVVACILILLLSAAVNGDDAMPGFVADMAHQFADESPDTAPLEIWSYLYRGATVYYVAPRYCCDLPGLLYDEAGELICYFGGGIAGSYHEGNCPDFGEARENGQLLWQHPERPVD